LVVYYQTVSEEADGVSFNSEDLTPEEDADDL
jgi:hypothetical protein